MIKAEQVGRCLHLTVEGIDAPFVIAPLPGRAGMQITNTYLEGTVGKADQHEVLNALRIAIDGGQKDPETGTYVPLDEADQTNYNRIQDELRTEEGESIMLPAFFWQTVLGMAGVNAYIEGGEGLAGGSKALWALAARLGLSPSTTSPSSALETLIHLEGTRPTSTPLGGAKPGKQPQDRLPKNPKQ